jgi:hypothetical protein
MFLDFVLNGSDEEMNVKLLALCLTIYTLASCLFEDRDCLYHVQK